MTSVDRISPDRRSANMRAIRASGTKPELTVRRLLHRLGYRYRVNVKGIEGKPDIVFKGRSKAIFVHGCFWHSHPGCPKAYQPKSRVEFWETKFLRNRARDAAVDGVLSARGWSTLVVWECEAVDSERLENMLVAFLEDSTV